MFKDLKRSGEEGSFLAFSIQTYISSKLVKMSDLDLPNLLFVIGSGGLYKLIPHVNAEKLEEGKCYLESKYIS